MLSSMLKEMFLLYTGVMKGIVLVHKLTYITKYPGKVCYVEALSAEQSVYR